MPKLSLAQHLSDTHGFTTVCSLKTTNSSLFTMSALHDHRTEAFQVALSAQNSSPSYLPASLFLPAWLPFIFLYPFSPRWFAFRVDKPSVCAGHRVTCLYRSSFGRALGKGGIKLLFVSYLPSSASVVVPLGAPLFRGSNDKQAF
jgi:hypothetical protein